MLRLRASIIAVLVAIMVALLATMSPVSAAEVAAGGTLVEQGLPAGYVAEYLTGVALVLAVLIALAWVARRMQGHAGAGRGALRVEASMPLGGKERLVIVEVEGERLLLGVGSGGVRTLSRLGAGGATATDSAGDGWLERALRGEPTA